MMNKAAIERFEQAVRDHEMAGSQPVEDRPLIEAEYREAKAALRVGPNWTHVKNPPKAGGPFVVGGYVEDGTLPRRFACTFAHCFLTVDGPEWSHSVPDRSYIPIEYWFDLPAHPEHRSNHT